MTYLRLYKMHIQNNPVLNIAPNLVIQTIGDPHLGKTFKTGVPSSKLGARETLVIKEFESLMFPTEESSITHVVVVGDLFDKYIVSPNIVMIAYQMFMKASKEYKHIEYYLIPGNHDFSRDVNKRSSYCLLHLMLQDLSNVHVVYDKYLHVVVDDSHSLFFDSYDPFHKERDESYYTFPFQRNFNMTSFGHWDSIKNEFGSYYPHPHIVDFSTTIVSGHIHTPEQFEKDEVQYIYTGSLQPYSHAEDPLHQYYVTVKYDVLEAILEEEQEAYIEDFKTKNVRISCYPGYVFPHTIECLSLTYFNNLVHDIVSKETVVNEATVSDFTTLYLQELKDTHNVDTDTLIKINNFLKDTSDNVHFSLD